GLIQAASRSHAGYVGTLFMGLTMGVVAAPCIGPFVLGLLTWVAGMGSPWLGFVVFFTLSLGLGLPLFFLAIFSGNLNRLPRSGEWMLWVRKLMGWILVAMAIYFIIPVLPKMVGILLPAIVALAAGLHLGWIDRTRASFRAFDWIKTTAGIAAVVIATLVIWNGFTQGPGISWKAYSDRLLAESKNESRPVIIAFSADWCSPCRELDAVTFHHAGVVQQAERHFTLIKVDVTQGGNPVHERLLKQYQVKGVPTVVFLDGQGHERVDLRLVDFVPPDPFLHHISGLIQTGSDK
ncbi:protein-disulfide reductase DsbD family protein, partial [Desulfosarcina sp.]|uniref:protein-disulfide reductase DsbD family protein n=1 Tax=Desulfosarcina sp. TaxID=2027861 RepID=UPI00356A6717